jgi:pimeloyl-ACP methyl ester carboxylesterase
MAAFVLVHGAWHNARCWAAVVPLLESAGHRVDAVDLPGHGESAAPVVGMTLEANARHVADRVEAAGEPVVLVGHSMGGMSITQAAELVPERIAALVYLCAFLPADGQSLPQLAHDLPDDLVQPNILADPATGLCTVAEEVRRDAFYGMCSSEDAAAWVAAHEPEALAVVGAPVAITEERAGSVRRVYVECLRDGAIPVSRQREMHGARPCERVFQLDSDHSPFLSAPEALAEILLAV